MTGSGGPRAVIARSRSLTDAERVGAAIDDALAELGIWPGEVLSGTAPGVDRIGERWAQARGIPVRRFPACWERYGRSAGIIRNRTMAAAADAVVVVWDGQSRGSVHMVTAALNLGIPTAVRVLAVAGSGAPACRRIPPAAVIRGRRTRRP